MDRAYADGAGTKNQIRYIARDFINNFLFSDSIKISGLLKPKTIQKTTHCKLRGTTSSLTLTVIDIYTQEFAYYVIVGSKKTLP